MDRIDSMKNIARAAGAFMLGADGLRSSKMKSNANDFVTVADIKSQDLIRKELLAAFPGELIVSEEDDNEERQQLQAEDFTGFVIDPIDGTYNFKREMRESAISIGYIENGKSICGVIFDPYRDELYEAELGKGARCNDLPIHVSKQEELAGSSVATSNGYDFAAAERNLERQIAIYKQTGVMPWISCPGSAVLTLAWIARGRVDAMHHTGFKPWDTAAAFIILSEAGGKITTLDGKEASFMDARLLAGNPVIVDRLNDVFGKLSPELLT
jgi:myo-inositol-1(or 4)-monophosphatase